MQSLIVPQNCIDTIVIPHLRFGISENTSRDCRLRQSVHSPTQALQPRFHILWQMNSKSSPVSLHQDLKVAAGLRRLNHSECVFLAGHRKIGRIVARDLEEDPGVWAAFVGLTGGMQKSRPETQARSYPLRSSTHADRLQSFFMRGVHLYVGEQREIVSGD